MKQKTPAIIYKRHSVLSLYCSVCKTFLRGNGSKFLPYNCECGIWDLDDYSTFKQFESKNAY